MQRDFTFELEQSFFLDNKESTQKNSARNPSAATKNATMEPPVTKVSSPYAPSILDDHKLAEIKNQIREELKSELKNHFLQIHTDLTSELNERLFSSIHFMNKELKGQNQKLVDMSQEIERLASLQEGALTRSQEKFTQLKDKITDYDSRNIKVEEMIDRHTQVLRAMESRMVHLQKLLAEKEAVLLNQKALLKEIRLQLNLMKG